MTLELQQYLEVNVPLSVHFSRAYQRNIANCFRGYQAVEIIVGSGIPQANAVVFLQTLLDANFIINIKFAPLFSQTKYYIFSSDTHSFALVCDLFKSFTAPRSPSVSLFCFSAPEEPEPLALNEKCVFSPVRLAPEDVQVLRKALQQISNPSLYTVLHNEELRKIFKKFCYIEHSIDVCTIL